MWPSMVLCDWSSDVCSSDLVLSPFAGCPDNQNGVITHLEPDILEGEVKWALGSISMNKASGGDGIRVELFHILEDDAVKLLPLIC